MKTPLMRILLLLAAFVLPAAPALCQTTVTGTVVDPNGNPYANGTASAIKAVATGQLAGTPTNVTTNSSGLFSMTLASPAAYLFTLCAAPVNIGPTTNPVPKQICFTSQPISISGASQDVGATLNALAAQLGPVGAAGNAANPSFNSITTGAVVASTIGPSATQQHTLPAVASDTVTLNAATQTLANKSTSAGSLVGTVASGTAAGPTSAIASLNCSAVVTATASGATGTDTIQWTYSTNVNINPISLITVSAWPTTNNVNFLFCNPTASSQTPTAVTLNWRVVR